VSTLVLPVLADFMREYPEIQLDLDFSDRLVDVIDEGFDAVVRTGEPADSRLTARKLGHFQMVLVASPEYLAAHGTPRNVQDLQSHRCLHFRWPHSGKLEAWPLPPGRTASPHGPGFHGLQQHRDPRLLRPAGARHCLPAGLRHPGAAGRRPPGARHARAGATRRGLPHPVACGQACRPKVRALVDYLCARVFAFT
jgi:DNA-binding transcriptional LysR family regulator